MGEALIIVGGGGHALSLADIAARLGHAVLGCVAPEVSAGTAAFLSGLGDDDVLDQPHLRDRPLLNGLGSAGPVSARRRIYRRFKDKGRSFATVVHPAASVSTLGVVLGEGCQVLAGAVLNAGVTLGDNVLVNSAAILEHGCRVGSHSHVASGAVLCGDCRLDESVHVGAGATLIQGIKVGAGAVIAAGSVVTKNVGPLTLVAGVPAREIRKIHEQELA